jgi:HK97 family phage portal protein
MGALDRILNRAMERGGETPLQRSWPVGHGNVYAGETEWGTDNQRWSPDEREAEVYATQNDIYSLISDRARLLSSLQLKFYKGSGSKKTAVESGRAVDLYRYVNRHWTPTRLARMDEMSMGIWGETYWAIEPPSRESPDGEIWWLKPSQVRPAKHPEKYVLGYWYQPIIGGQRIWFEVDEVIWFRYPNPLEEHASLSPIVAAKLAADTSNAMMRSNKKLFDQGMQLAGLVTPTSPDLTFSEDQANDLERHLQKRFVGAEKAHRWAVLRFDAAFRQMSVTPKDAEFIAGLNLSFRSVCRAYGMQPSLHGDLEQASPGDTEALEKIEWSRTLKPDAELRAEEIKEQYLLRFVGERGAPDHVEFDFSQIPALQDALAAIHEREAGWMDRGLLTINEWRENHGYPPVPWGDAPWLPMNKGQWMTEGEEPKGTLVIPGQNAPGAPGAQEGLPQDAVQGGPQLTDEQGVPLPKPPDDEVNPVALPQRSVHMQARDFLAQGEVQDFLAHAFKRNGHDFGRRNGHKQGAK